MKTNTAPAASAQARNVVRWVVQLRREPGCPARRGSFRITTTNARGLETSALYMVYELLDGAQFPVGWQLVKLDDEGTPVASYNLDTTACTTFRPDAREIVCDCAAATYRPERGPCKHARAIAAALPYANVV